VFGDKTSMVKLVAVKAIKVYSETLQWMRSFVNLMPRHCMQYFSLQILVYRISISPFYFDPTEHYPFPCSSSNWSSILQLANVLIWTLITSLSLVSD